MSGPSVPSRTARNSDAPTDALLKVWKPGSGPNGSEDFLVAFGRSLEARGEAPGGHLGSHFWNSVVGASKTQLPEKV